MELSLLGQALAVKPKLNDGGYTPEMIELAVAWANRQVRGVQVEKTIRLKTSSRNSLYAFVASAIRAGIELGIVSCEITKGAE